MSLNQFSNNASLTSSRDEPLTANFVYTMSESQNPIANALPKFVVPQPSPVTPLEQIDCMSMVGDFGYTVTNFAEKPFDALISPNQNQADSTCAFVKGSVNRYTPSHIEEEERSETLYLPNFHAALRADEEMSAAARSPMY